jgi:hypothetical protein
LIDNPSWQHFATHDESEHPELWRGVRGYWAPCLGPSGTRLHDVGGLNNWGTLTNMDAATDWVVDGGRYALDFDGSNDVVDVPWTLFNGAANASYSAWFRRIAISSQGPMFGAGVSGQNIRFNTIAFPDGRIYVTAVNGANNPFGFFSSNDVNLHNLVVVYDGSGPTNADRLKTYLDGVMVSLTFNDTIPSTLGSMTSWRMGTSQFTSDIPGTGRIFENVAWTRSLSANEVLQLYQIGRGGMLTPRQRRRAYFVQTFSPSWASGSNVVLQPSIGVS